MKKALTITAVAAALLLGLAAAALVVLSAYAPQPFDDPASARCHAPNATFGAARVRLDHREIGVRFACAGAVIAGTLSVPDGRGPHPAVVWVHGAGESARLPYAGTPLIQTLVRSGIAVLSYDKRGVGESEGECCPGDYGQFNLVAADAVGAVSALRARPEIDPDRIGLLGGSQAGWIVPLAAARSQHRVAFTALVDAPVVSFGEENLYSQKTGDEGFVGKLAWGARTAVGLRTPGPSGFDPRPLLARTAIPGIWLYGGEDRSQPTTQDVAVIERLKAQGKNFTVVVYPQAGHGLLDVPPTDPRALPTVVDWILEQVAVFRRPALGDRTQSSRTERRRNGVSATR